MLRPRSNASSLAPARPARFPAPIAPAQSAPMRSPNAACAFLRSRTIWASCAPAPQRKSRRSRAADLRYDPVEHRGPIRFDVACLDLAHLIAALDEPRAPLAPRLGGLLALPGRSEIDHGAQRERHHVDNMASDRRLPLEAVSGEAAVLGERVPQQALGLGRITPQKPREPTDRRALGCCPALFVLGQERAQHFRLLAVEDSAARRALAPLRHRQEDARKRLNVLPCRLHAIEDVAQVDRHGLVLLRRPEELDLVELALD